MDVLSCGGSDGEGNIYEYQYEEDENCIRPRKRQRLTHLSPGEKLQRRKMKNRVAAQAARDRRKMYMDELEEEVAKLRADKEKLEQENALLRQQQICSKCSMKVEGVPTNTNTAEASVISTLVKSESTSKSAVLSPQQKEMVQTLLVLMTMACCSTTSQKNSSNCTPTFKVTAENSNTEPLDLTKNTQNIFQQWWGAHQSSWNPSKTM